MSRLGFLVALFGSLLAPLSLVRAAKPKKPFEPSDEMLAMAIPSIELAIQDPAELQKMIDQSERVLGAERLNQLIWKIICLKRPDIAGRRVMGRIIRRNLGI